jgi:hypothetical protein
MHAAECEPRKAHPRFSLSRDMAIRVDVGAIESLDEKSTQVVAVEW